MRQEGHIAAWKAWKAGFPGPVYLIGEGTRYPYWQCATPYGPWTFTLP